MSSIIDALPHVFKRPLQKVEAGTSIFVAGTLLDIPRRDIFVITSVRGTNVRLFSRNRTFLAFGGYGLLGALLRTDPKDYYKFLFERIERASLPIRCVDADSELSRVFEVMSETELGWLLVREDERYAIVSLADLLPLYAKNTLATDLHLGDVATAQVFSMAAGTRLDDALRELIGRRIRRVFLSGTSKFVSDREILEHIFSLERLQVVRESPKKMLRSRLAEVGPASATRADADLQVTKMARTFDATSGAHCYLTGKGLVTPWDLVMKPWIMGGLKIAEAGSSGIRRRAE
jgi:CBS domain-containing protein